jgi:hypothetical protein
MVKKMRLNAETLDELVDRARQRGGVSIEDLRQWLPIESMTVEDVSSVLARLDEAGLDVEIDPMMLLSAGTVAPQGHKSAPNRESAEPPEPMSRSKPNEPDPGSRSSSERSSTAHQTVRSSQAISASALPWVLAFAIVVLVCFAAFAF